MLSMISLSFDISRDNLDRVRPSTEQQCILILVNQNVLNHHEVQYKADNQKHQILLAEDS